MLPTKASKTMVELAVNRTTIETDNNNVKAATPMETSVVATVVRVATQTNKFNRFLVQL